MPSPNPKRHDAAEETEAYRRRKRPVPVRSRLFDWRDWPWRRIGLSLAALGVVLGGYRALLGYVAESPRFRFDATGLTVGGLDFVAEPAVRAIFAADAGGALREIPLDERRAQVIALEAVADATLTRLWPSRLHVQVVERKALAIVLAPGQGESRLQRLIDRDGVTFEPPPGRELDLPLIDGLRPGLSRDELRERVDLLLTVKNDLEAHAPGSSARVELFDLADPKNVRLAVVRDGERIWLEMGRELFGHRFQVFEQRYQEWRREHGPFESVNLRYPEFVSLLPAAPAPRAPRR